MLKLVKVILAISAVVVLCSCKFPDNEPMPGSIIDYIPQNLNYNKTTINDFLKLAPTAIGKKIMRDTTVFSLIPSNDMDYSKIRVGFKNNLLDWIEFSLYGDTTIDQFIKVYGKPQNINTKHSKLYDYYDYDTFNISKEKNSDIARHITLFGISKKANIISTKEDITPLKCDLPKWNELKSFNKVTPGITIETEFNEEYPELVPDKTDNITTTSTYDIDTVRCGMSKNYKNAYMNFENGLLSSIYLIPNGLNYSKIVGLYGACKKPPQKQGNYIFYDYSNFIILVDMKTKEVKNIGIISDK